MNNERDFYTQRTHQKKHLSLFTQPAWLANLHPCLVRALLALSPTNLLWTARLSSSVKYHLFNLTRLFAVIHPIKPVTHSFDEVLRSILGNPVALGYLRLRWFNHSSKPWINPNSEGQKIALAHHSPGASSGLSQPPPQSPAPGALYATQLRRRESQSKAVDSPNLSHRAFDFEGEGSCCGFW